MRPKMIFIALLLLMLTTAKAEETVTPETPKLLTQFVDMMDGMCPQLVMGLTSRPDLRGAFKARPTDVSAVCTCTKSGILADPKLSEQFRVTQEVLVEKLRTTSLQSYATVRLIKSSLVCLAQDIDKSLDKVRFEQ